MIKTTDYALPLPWHRSLWKSWYNAALSNKLPHALLVKGPIGAGKLSFVQAFSKLMLCEQPKWLSQDELYSACGLCPDCLSYEVGSHPNYYEIKPNHSNTTQSKILIEQIRDLIQSLHQTATQRTALKQHTYHTLIVIGSMELLKTTQHALLKTLEEPRKGVLFIMASAYPNTLEPTIRSRCQCVTLPQPDFQQSTDWLQLVLQKQNVHVDADLLRISLDLNCHRPIHALEYLKHNEINNYQLVIQSLVRLGIESIYPLDVVDKWLKQPLEKLLTYLMYATNQLIQQKLNPTFNSQHLSVSNLQATEVTYFFKQVSITSLLAFWDRLIELRHDMRLYNLNPRIALEMLAYTLSNSRSFSSAR